MRKMSLSGISKILSDKELKSVIGGKSAPVAASCGGCLCNKYPETECGNLCKKEPGACA
jgi:bacteriocin-like protein